MATITATINVKDENEIAIRRDMAAAFGYTDTVDDGSGNQIPNPINKAKFVQRELNDRLREIVKNTLNAYRETEALRSIVKEDITIPQV